MKNKFSTILFGFILIISLMLSMIFFSLYRIVNSNSMTHDVLQRELSQNEYANQMLQVSDLRVVLLTQIMHEEDVFIRDNLIQQFYAIGLKFSDARNKIMQSAPAPDEQAILEQQRELAKTNVPIQHKILDLVTDGHYEQAHDLYTQVIIPVQRKISGLLHQLISYQTSEIMLGTQHIRNYQNKSYIILSTASVIAFIVTVFITIYVYRKTRRDFSHLSKLKETLQKTNIELENREYALDQHAIVSITDTAGTIIDVNDMFCEVSGYTKQELLGKKHNIINSGYHPASLFNDMWKTISSGKTWQGTIRNQKKNGDYYWVETTITPLLDKDNKPYQYIAIRTDITHLISVEQKLGRLTEKLIIEAEKSRESERLKTAILATLTHELRTPLNAIIGFTQLLEVDKADFDQEQQSTIENISSSSDELLNKIDNIILLGRFHSNNIKADLNENILKESIESALNSFHNELSDKHIQTSINCDADLLIMADHKLLVKALCYIVDNAIKFTNEGSITIHCTPDDNENEIIIAISDTGIGIEKQQLDFIFDEFRQADEELSRHFEGFGIGLAITRYIVELHNGRIWIESTPGKGTTVYIALPAHKFEEQSIY